MSESVKSKNIEGIEVASSQRSDLLEGSTNIAQIDTSDSFDINSADYTLNLANMTTDSTNDIKSTIRKFLGAGNNVPDQDRSSVDVFRRGKNLS